MEKKKDAHVAVVQAGSVVMDKQACIEKAVRLIEDAGGNGANIIVFPEAFVPAYPRGMTFGAVVGSRSDEGRRDFLTYWQNSITVPGPETEVLGRAAKQAGAYVVIGVIEKDASGSEGTLYCTALFFAPNGELLGKHRKLKPTGSERLIWGEGDGGTLPVFDTPYGKIGALICWENYMPLARTSMYEKGIEIYIAPTADHRDVWFSTMRHIAVEGRCFVLSCNQYSTKDMYPEAITARSEFQDVPHELTRGGSCIVDPLGNFIVEPVFGKEEILYATIQVEDVYAARYDFDVVGHYARPDVFQLVVHEEERKNLLRNHRQYARNGND